MDDAPVIPVTITPVPDSRLEQLISQYAMLKARARQSQEVFDACTDAIKAEVCGSCPQAKAFVIPGSAHWPALKLTWSNPWRLDTRRLKDEQAAIYVSYAVRSERGRWELRQADAS